jgi:hypothetical protein
VPEKEAVAVAPAPGEGVEEDDAQPVGERELVAVADTLGEGVGDVDREGEAVGLDESVEEADSEGVPEAEALLERTAVAVVDTVPEPLTLGDGDAPGVREALRDWLPLGEALPLREAKEAVGQLEGEGERLCVGLAVGVPPLGVGVARLFRDALLEPLRVSVGDAEKLAHADAAAVGVAMRDTEPLALRHAVGELEEEGESEDRGDADTPALVVVVGHREGEAAGVPVPARGGLGEALVLIEGEPLCDWLAVPRGDAVKEEDGVRDGDGEPLVLGERDAPPLADTECVMLSDAVEEPDEEGLVDALAVGVHVRLDVALPVDVGLAVDVRVPEVVALEERVPVDVRVPEVVALEERVPVDVRVPEVVAVEEGVPVDDHVLAGSLRCSAPFHSTPRAEMKPRSKKNRRIAAAGLRRAV